MGKTKKLKKGSGKSPCETLGCYEKGKENGEHLFTLRSQDYTMPHTIMYWILMNLGHASDEKLREAFEKALLARNWPDRKMPD